MQTSAKHLSSATLEMGEECVQTSAMPWEGNTLCKPVHCIYTRDNCANLYKQRALGEYKAMHCVLYFTAMHCAALKMGHVQ